LRAEGSQYILDGGLGCAVQAAKEFLKSEKLFTNFGNKIVEVKFWTHGSVNRQGMLKAGGGVNTTPGIYPSLKDGCTLPECRCIKTPWVAFNFGYNRKTKSVSGVTVYFEDEAALNKFIRNFNHPCPRKKTIVTAPTKHIRRAGKKKLL
jgi:hypothetical protein